MADFVKKKGNVIAISMYQMNVGNFLSFFNTLMPTISTLNYFFIHLTKHSLILFQNYISFLKQLNYIKLELKNL